MKQQSFEQAFTLIGTCSDSELDSMKDVPDLLISLWNDRYGDEPFSISIIEAIERFVPGNHALSKKIIDDCQKPIYKHLQSVSKTSCAVLKLLTVMAEDEDLADLIYLAFPWTMAGRFP